MIETSEKPSNRDKMNTDHVNIDIPTWIKSSVNTISNVQYKNTDFSLNIETNEDLLRIFDILHDYHVLLSDIPYEVYDYILITNPSCLFELSCLNNENIAIKYFQDIINTHVVIQPLNSHQNQQNSNKNSLKKIYNSLKLFYNRFKASKKENEPITYPVIETINFSTLLEYSVFNNDSQLMKYIIEYKNISFIHDIPTPRAKKMTMIASKYGHLNVLTYLHHHQCPLSASCIRWAKKRNQNHCLEFLYQVNCPWREPSEEEIESFMSVTVTHFQCIEVMISLLETTCIDIDMKGEVSDGILAGIYI